MKVKEVQSQNKSIHKMTIKMIKIYKEKKKENFTLRENQDRNLDYKMKMININMNMIKERKISNFKQKGK